MRSRRGNAIFELILWMPILMLLIVGMVQVGKITYIYYTLKKTLNTVGTFAAQQQGVNFCTDTNDVITAAKNFALSGSTDGSVSESFLPALTPDMIQVKAQCYSADNGMGDCSQAGCDADNNGGQRPDFLVISIPDGYQVTPRIPYMLVDPILLKPQVVVAYTGS